MNARRPEPRPRQTYTYWPAARPPGRVAAPAPPPRSREYLDAPWDIEERLPPPMPDEPGYGHGV